MDRSINCSGFGEVSPNSQFEIVCLVTFTFSASFSCENPFSFLNAFIFFPNSISHHLQVIVYLISYLQSYQTPLELAQRILTFRKFFTVYVED